MKTALISDLQQAAKTRRDGYLEACFQHGRVSQNKMFLTFDDKTHAALRAQFTPRELHPKPKPRFKLAPAHTIGLGDAIHAVAMPIARKLKLPCVKPNGQLRALSGCAMRRSSWNQIQIPTPAGLLASAKKIVQKTSLNPLKLWPIKANS